MNTNIEMMKLGESKNGVTVYQHPTSHVHIDKTLVTEVISKLTIEGGYHFETVDMGRVIGNDHLIETSENTPVFYAVRPYSYEPLKLRNGESRMTWNNAKPTPYITIGLCVDTDPDELQGKWCIFTVFEGKPGEKEPWDRAFEDGKNPEGLKKAEEFWANHALSCTEQEREYFIKQGIYPQ